MGLYSAPPPLEPFSYDKPTLLVCWWATIFSSTIILLRVSGRFVRSERLFLEDKVAALALIPLYLRMGCVHVILIYGTNNVQLAGLNLPQETIDRMSIGSGLVLLSRVLYAATLWTLKGTILEFFRRLNISWERSYLIMLNCTRVILVATFIAIVISDLAECQPFSHYWQVLPDPGGQCRQGYAQLLTMATCNVLTDLMLVIFPIPIILQSSLNFKRKVHLILLFSVSLAVVATTLYRVPHIIHDHGSQRVRSLYASIEILFATVAANVLVLGSFVRDRGVKKTKFKYGSIAATSLDRPLESGPRRPTLHNHWGSLEDLARDTGFGVQPQIQHSEQATTSRYYTPATIATMQGDFNSWQVPRQNKASFAPSHDPYDPSRDQFHYYRNNSAASARKVTFFDVGGLLDDKESNRRESHVSSSDTLSPNSAPAPTMPASATGFRRGSTTFLQDIGGRLNPLLSRAASQRAVEETALPSLPHSSPQRSATPAYPTSPENPGLELMDLGGLLNDK